MRGYGYCPGSCGELVQGLFGNEECISSYAINRYSYAMVSEGKKRRLKKKSYEAAKATLNFFDIPIKELNNLNIKIKSDIPVGKGMSSSTADIGATIMGVSNFFEKKIQPIDLAKIASSIEPTDSIFFKELCIFNPVTGKIIKTMGNLPFKKVMILEPISRVNTVNIRKLKQYKQLKHSNMEITTQAFKLLNSGIKNQDKSLIKKACIMSAMANEGIVKKPFLREIIDISETVNAGGLNIAHSGTVIGIFLDENTDEEKLRYLLDKHKITQVYKNKRILEIIPGGAGIIINGKKEIL